MGMNLTEKILAHAAGVDTAKPGDILWVKVDGAMMDDILGPRVEIAEHMRRLNKTIWDPSKVTIISDHYTPPANAKQAEIVKFTREWAKEYGVTNYYEFSGPCHQVMMDEGRVGPGHIVVGTDSHTCTYGALSAFSTGIGSTEMLGVLCTGEIWLRVPESLLFNCNGTLGHRVMAKDLVLRIIGEVGHNGATYKAMEFRGSVFDTMIMDERLCMANMAVEAGAKNGIFPYDAITEEFLEKTNAPKGHVFTPDEDARYEKVYDIDVDALEPLCACPHEVDNVTEIKNVKNVKIHQAYIGSCTGGRYHDLKMAADLLKGHHVAPGVRLLISPASRKVWEECARDGILTTLSEAGATVLASSCGACLGVHSGAVGAGEVCVSSTNRNFIGRMGSKDAGVYLASPLSVAASAITGVLTDPRTI